VEVGDASLLTSFSIDGEHRLHISSEGTQSLSNVLRDDSSGRVLVKPYRRSSWLFSSSHTLKFNIFCLVLLITIGYDDCWGIKLVGGAGGEFMWAVRTSISVIRRRE
jgi:hypothetical protein